MTGLGTQLESLPGSGTKGPEVEDLIKIPTIIPSTIVNSFLLCSTSC